MNIIPTFVRGKIIHRPYLIKVLDNIGWLFLDKILRIAVGLFVGVWFARYLGPEQFGLLSFTYAFIELFTTIATLGLREIVVRNIVQSPDSKNEVLGTAAFMQFTAGLIGYGLILAGIFWLRPDDSPAKIIVAILGTVILFKFSEVALYWFESQVMSKYIALMQNCCFLVFSAIKLVLIFQHAPLTSFVLATVLETFVVALLMIVMFSRQAILLSSLTVSFARAKNLFKDSWPLMLSGLAIMIYMKTDQIMLGQMMGNHAVGIYSVATRISEAWYFLPVIIVASIFPSILEAQKKGRKEYLQRYQNLHNLMVWMSISIAIPMTFLSELIIVYIFGAEFKDSSPVLAIHIWTSVFVFLGVASSKWLISENLQKLIFYRTAIGAILNIGFNFLLIPFYGVVGAAISTLIAQIIVVLFFDPFQRKTRPLFYIKLKAFNPTNLIKLKMRIQE